MELRDNRLLGLLPPAALAQIEPHLEPTELRLHETLPGDHVYFPLSGLISTVTTLEDGSMVEAAIAGRDGAAGLPFISPRNREQQLIVQAGGNALAFPAARVRAEIHNLPDLVLLLARYSELMFNFAAQSAACNRHHASNQRLARWLLLVSRHLHSDRFLVTHELLAQMLGLHRPTVSVAAMTLRQVGCISYVRGKVVIRDRPALEREACECYWIMRELSASFFD